MKNKDLQQAAREAWKWLSAWVKKNKKDLYRQKYLGKALAERIGCHPSAVSLWKHGRMSFERENFERVMVILDEWCELLPKQGWVTPFHYSDENKVQHVVDYRDAANGVRLVKCDRRCTCGQWTPSEGKHCMYCGHEMWRVLE